MSRSKKWRLEWAFFLGENGRRQYNKLCKGCVHPCKQSLSMAWRRVHSNSMSAVSAAQPKEDTNSFPSVLSGLQI